MSPRAAWRLERLGFTEVYDYAAGKVDWMAAGLPTEGNGTHPPRVLEAMDADPPTCDPTERVADVGFLRIEVSKPHTIVFNPIVGVIALVAGIVLVMIGRRPGS